MPADVVVSRELKSLQEETLGPRSETGWQRLRRIALKDKIEARGEPTRWLGVQD
jgi:hypothetical protein